VNSEKLSTMSIMYSVFDKERVLRKNEGYNTYAIAGIEPTNINNKKTNKTPETRATHTPPRTTKITPKNAKTNEPTTENEDNKNEHHEK